MDRFQRFIGLPFSYHLVIGAFIRLSFIAYADFHDKAYDVPYTDVDYKVFTDAARHVLNGQSPYKRHTYRYSPIIAYLMVPNLLIGKDFGKILFSLLDVLVTIAIKKLVQKQTVPKIATYCSLFWLYNPMSIAISTRGNADSFPGFLIIMTLFFLQTDIVKGFLKYVLSGFLLGVSIHLRLYPLAFSFPMYLSLGGYNRINRNTRIMDGIIALMPNKKQLTLAFSCIGTLFLLTYGMYMKYGYEFLFETYIYHLFRKDTRHNFSLLFYHSYLTMDQLSLDLLKVVTLFCEMTILFVASLAYGCESKTLPFALFVQSVVLVTYNSVVTSQYFIWYLSLLPLVVQDFKLPKKKAMKMASLWVIAQGAWLFFAYLLEFNSQPVFLYIWVASAVFFLVNTFLLGQLIASYTPGYDFNQMDGQKARTQ